MNIVAVDDEKIALERLITTIKEAETEAKVTGFRSTREALDYIGSNSCDIVFLDIEMREMNGISLAKKIKKINPEINVIFTTGYSEYSIEAFNMHVSGYILKPVTKEKIAEEIRNLRYPIRKDAINRVRVKTFGNFEVFLDEKPANFQHGKTKELFAYLIDRNGALCTNREIIAVLWEDKKNESYYKKLRLDLFRTLPEDLFIRQWGKLAICPEKIDCDYYDWQKGTCLALNAFRGEYMTQYSWGEQTLSRIENL